MLLVGTAAPPEKRL
uniref:Uncharacterized protein n=1 Tax=Anguilla anguilla TaxID=7936 RepID=A0A0E9QKK9_ANGAN